MKFGCPACLAVLLFAAGSWAQDDVAEITSRQLTAGKDPDKRYFLIGESQGSAPESGYGLLLVLPGGDGGEGFHPFVKRIYKHATPPGFLVAQLVAVKWATQKLVWPSGRLRVPGQKFTTEEFIDAVITDVKVQQRIDPRRVFVLAWSSSGPAAYAAALRAETPITGAFIAMSVFYPANLDMAGAQGQRFYLYHSPGDKVCRFVMARSAETLLGRKGAVVKLTEYEGGHGFTSSSVWPDIRAGLAWLDEGAATSRPAGTTLASKRPASSSPARSTRQEAQ